MNCQSEWVKEEVLGLLYQQSGGKEGWLMMLGEEVHGEASSSSAEEAVLRSYQSLYTVRGLL